MMDDNSMADLLRKVYQDAMTDTILSESITMKYLRLEEAHAALPWYRRLMKWPRRQFRYRRSLTLQFIHRHLFADGRYCDHDDY